MTTADSERASEFGQVLNKFVSLGVNCEFGLVQRKCGIEPLGLFRFAYTPFEGLLRALNSRFSGIQDPNLLSLRVDNQREYIVTAPHYGFEFHTLTKTDWQTEEEVRHHFLSKRLPLLVRKTIEELELSEKTFVIRGEVDMSLEEAMRLSDAIKLYGSASLLWVTLAPSPEQIGTVRRLSDRLLVGYLDKMSPLRLAVEFSLAPWLQICTQAQTS